MLAIARDGYRLLRSPSNPPLLWKFQDHIPPQFEVINVSRNCSVSHPHMDVHICRVVREDGMVGVRIEAQHFYCGIHYSPV